ITAASVEGRDDFASASPRVIDIPPVLSERAPAPHELILTEYCAVLRRLPLQQIFLNRMIRQAQLGSAPFPDLGDLLPDRKTILRISRRRLDEVGDFLRAEALVQLEIAVRRAGHAHRAPARLRHVFPSCADKSVAGHPLWASPTRVKAVKLPLPVREDERVAA